eukprot:Plantae.Rhodophyta-Rhodochaete_pulchella.ctg935.p1 GENE.Plantae.Rhodophyta-Rhodochaete_pulchella.ctg935~~Plantae.Rhodophyta-Rhodochaete_pulchella.ctg935.p1  ORF type:complete len:503 (-),score=115.66 Plantae.Rhodophyta-Rhodochaete_pulchella.ctg935:1297-2757(-)
MSALFLLFEGASGYALLRVQEAEDVALETEAVMSATAEYARFSQMVKLEAFSPFPSAEDALENIHAISDGSVTEFLTSFLAANLPLPKKVSKKTPKFQLGVHDTKTAQALVEAVPTLPVTTSERVAELLRGVRMHFAKLHGDLSTADMDRAQLGLAHAYSRSRVKFNVHKSDNMIIQSIALLDQLDKDISTFAMRVREWYSWHFPELYKVVPDNYQYAQLVKVIRSKSNLTDPEMAPELLPELNKILGDEDKAQEVIDASRSSMGTDVSELDLINIESFASRVVQLVEYRASLHNYLIDKMQSVAPNLATLLGEQVAARLISHAGSLTNLAKYPASTVQILGAEKALFRALKTKGKTPKYGLLFHSSFIGRAKMKNKGRISRYLANKCSIASRVDCFADEVSDVFGQKLKAQVEERLRFYDTGAAPRKNLDVMKEAIAEAKAALGEDAMDEEPKADETKTADKKTDEKKTDEKKKKKKSKKKDKER